MKRKLSLLAGLAIGYVIGARAGRGKYDKLKSSALHYWQDPRVTRVRTDIEDYARTQTPIVRERAETIARDVAGKTAATAKDVAATAKDVADKTAATAKDVADKTAATAKDVAAIARDIADRTAATARGVADRTSVTAKSVADHVGGVADDVRGQVVKTATDLKDRGEDAVERVTLTVSEARDRALEDDLGDLDDDDDVVALAGEDDLAGADDLAGVDALAVDDDLAGRPGDDQTGDHQTGDGEPRSDGPTV